MSETGEMTVIIWLLKELESKGLLTSEECKCIIAAYLPTAEQEPGQAA